MEAVHFNLRIDPTKVPTFGKITPYPFQWEIIEDVKQYIRDQRARFKAGEPVQYGFVTAYVSAGKTIILGALAAHCTNVGAKCLILTRTGELVSQNADECWNMNCPVSVYSASSGYKKRINSDYKVIVGSEGTVVNGLETDLAGFVPHIILIDECHEVNHFDVVDPKAGTTQYAQILNHYKRLNPGVVVIGVTGTPYRGCDGIKSKDFWVNQIGRSIDREFLVANGYIVPTIFDLPQGLGYDFSGIDLGEINEGIQDYTPAQLKAMEEAISEDKTRKIMEYVVKVMEKRLGALITCASERHCREAASVLPEGSWGIVTESTTQSERAAILKGAKTGKIKYVLQIGCLTTGVNVPFWDTSVILRKIGSLTLLTQLLGRGMRLLKPEHEKIGWRKTDHLCMDFSDTMKDMFDMYDDPMVSEAVSKQKRENNEKKFCPKECCQAENGISARRCNAISSETGLRCDHFWMSVKCKNPDCKADNDVKSKECRICGEQLIDPNKKLNGTRYKMNEWKPVKSMTIVPTRNKNGIVVTIHLDCKTFEGKPEVARLTFYPWSSQGSFQKFKHNFVKQFISDYKLSNKILAQKNVDGFMSFVEHFHTPPFITHRVGEHGSIVNLPSQKVLDEIAAGV